MKRRFDALDRREPIMARGAGRTPIDLERLASLGEMVWPGGDEAEIFQIVKQVKARQLPRCSRAARPSHNVHPWL